MIMIMSTDISDITLKVCAYDYDYDGYVASRYQALSFRQYVVGMLNSECW